MYRTTLFVIHILGAIAGIGPTFAFGVLGKLSGQMQDQAVGLLTAMLDIEKKIVTPVALFTQPLTGVLLIFETGRNVGFFQREWLVIAIVLFAIILYLSYLVDQPAIHRTVTAMKTGEGVGSPQFQKDIRTAQRLGPLFGVMTVVIIILMVWKPLDSV